eukprot:g328.t1
MSSPLALFYFSIPVFAGCVPRRATLSRQGEQYRHLLFEYDPRGGGLTFCRTPDASLGKQQQSGVGVGASVGGAGGRSGGFIYRCEYQDVPRGRAMKLLEVRGIDGQVLLQHEVQYDDFGRLTGADVTKAHEATGAIFKDLPSGPESYALELYFSSLPRGTSRRRYVYGDPRLRFHPTAVYDERLKSTVTYSYKTDADGLVTERTIATLPKGAPPPAPPSSPSSTAGGAGGVGGAAGAGSGGAGAGGAQLQPHGPAAPTSIHRYMYDEGTGHMTHDINVMSGDIEEYTYDDRGRLAVISHGGNVVFN